MIVEFTSNYSPRKKGEVADLEKRLAEHYIALGVAKEHCECEDKKPCIGCGDANKVPEGVEVNMVTNETIKEHVEEKKPNSKKSTKK